jgi:hypothetical protein
MNPNVCEIEQFIWNHHALFQGTILEDVDEITRSDLRYVQNLTTRRVNLT